MSHYRVRAWMRTRWIRLLSGRTGPALLLGGLGASFYVLHLLGIATFPDGDFTGHFLPFSMFQRQAMASLQAPLWNPYTYSGHPFWADIQAAALYPVSNILLLLTLPFDGAPARLYFLQVEAILHTMAAGYFVYLLARDLSGSRAGGLAAGICFMLSGYLTGYPPLQLAALRTAVWLPLLLWLSLRAWREPQRWRFWIGAAAVLAISFLAGHAQTWLYIAYATAAWIVALAWGDHGGVHSGTGRDRLAGLAAFAVISAGLVTAQAIPSLEFARLSVRADVDYAYVSGGFAVQDLWNLLLPHVLTQFSPLYIGPVGLGLAMIGTGLGLRDPLPATMRFGRMYFVGLTLFSLVASLGENGFLYPLLYRVAPGWEMFRGQERAAYLATLGMSILAGYGMALTPHVSVRWRKRYALVYGALVTAAVYAFGMLWQLPGRSAVSDWRYLTIAFATLVVAMGLAVALRLDGWSHKRTALLCALAAATLFVTNFTTNLDMVSPAAKAGSRSAQPPELLALQEAQARLGVTDGGLPARAYNEYRVYDDYGMIHQIEDVWGSSPLRLAHYSRLFDQFPLDRMWRLTGVRYVLTWRKELFGPSELLGEFAQDQDTTYVHRLPEENPRAWLVENVIVADDEAAWSMLADHSFDLDSNIVLPPETGATAAPSSLGTGKVRLRRAVGNRIEINITTRGGGVLAVSENWMPGWRVQNATCDGLPCALGGSSPNGLEWLSPVRANLAFLAIPVPKGDVQLELVYLPDSVRIGGAISIATVMAVAAAALVRLWGRRW